MRHLTPSLVFRGGPIVGRQKSGPFVSPRTLEQMNARTACEQCTLAREQCTLARERYTLARERCTLAREQLHTGP